MQINHTFHFSSDEILDCFMNDRPLNDYQQMLYWAERFIDNEDLNKVRLFRTDIITADGLDSRAAFFRRVQELLKKHEKKKLDDWLESLSSDSSTDSLNNLVKNKFNQQNKKRKTSSG